MRSLWIFVISAVIAHRALAVPHASSKDREHRQADLSKQEHYNPEREHNPEYDHEAFLGEEQAKEFDKLPEAESVRRLGIIADKIDANKDGKITKEELKEWISHTSRRYVLEDVNRQWPNLDINGDGYVTWDEYRNRTYGYMEDTNQLDEIYDTHRQLTYREMIDRDEKRFRSADKDADGKATKDEFGDFLHPEDTVHMKDIVIDETMQDMDKDKDGYVTVEEYINDLWPESERKANPEEPSWVQSEKDQFRDYRDKDKDGKLNKEELGMWIVPQDYDHVEAEAAHLIFEADADKDSELTKKEILDHHDVFVGSQATDYGEALYRHDEF